MTIKALIFDFGNVICEFDNHIFLHKISTYTDKPIKELNDLIYVKCNLPIKYETGLISSDEFYIGIKELCSIDIGKTKFRKAYTNIFTPIESTFELIKKLKSFYKLGLLSNVSEWDFEFGIKPISIFSLFDTLSLSFEVGAMKPRKEIYLDALVKLKLPAEECVYIDDVSEFVDVARSMRINGIHYRNYENLVSSLERLDIKLKDK